MEKGQIKEEQGMKTTLRNARRLARKPIRANISRDRSLEEYNKNPNYCKFCNIKMEVPDWDTVWYVKSKTFCSLQCNTHYRWQLEKGGDYTPRFKDRKAQIERTLEELEVDNKKRVTVGQRARRFYGLNFPNQECEICGYNAIVEIAHVKAVSSFSKDTTVKTVNELSNLIGLCPNHHREYDKGLLEPTLIQEALNKRSISL